MAFAIGRGFVTANEPIEGGLATTVMVADPLATPVPLSLANRTGTELAPVKFGAITKSWVVTNVTVAALFWTIVPAGIIPPGVLAAELTSPTVNPRPSAVVDAPT
jgi:hypothetical protein